jgi:hypothetical protein
MATGRKANDCYPVPVNVVLFCMLVQEFNRTVAIPYLGRKYGFGAVPVIN